MGRERRRARAYSISDTVALTLPGLVRPSACSVARLHRGGRWRKQSERTRHACGSGFAPEASTRLIYQLQQPARGAAISLPFRLRSRAYGCVIAVLSFARSFKCWTLMRTVHTPNLIGLPVPPK
jgi:hypothetical protein